MMTIGADDAGIELLKLRWLHLRILLISLLQLLLASVIRQRANHGSAITDSIIFLPASAANNLALLGLWRGDGDRIRCPNCIPLPSSCSLSILWTQLRV